MALLRRRKTEIRRLLEITHNESATFDVLEAIFFTVLTDLILKKESYLPFVGLIRLWSGKGINPKGQEIVKVGGTFKMDSDLKKSYLKFVNYGMDKELIHKSIEKYILRLKDILER